MIIRIENSWGEGPYQSPIPQGPLQKHSWNSDKHPSIYNDQQLATWQIAEELHLWVCGFLSFSQMNKWFDDECIKHLSIHNFYISLYDVNPEWVRTSSYQCIFKKEKAILQCQVLCSSYDRSQPGNSFPTIGISGVGVSLMLNPVIPQNTFLECSTVPNQQELLSATG